MPLSLVSSYSYSVGLHGLKTDTPVHCSVLVTIKFDCSCISTLHHGVTSAEYVNAALTDVLRLFDCHFDCQIIFSFIVDTKCLLNLGHPL